MSPNPTASDHSTVAAFDGRTVLVTGAAGDIGRATALRLAKEGARLVLADQSSGIEDTAAMCVQALPQIVPVTMTFDVTDEAAVQRAFAELDADGVVVDLLFNNAGYQGEFCNIVDYDTADFRRVLEVNVVGVFNVLKWFARSLIAAGLPGAVVNTASMAHGGAPNMAAYSSSKAGVKALTKTAAKDLAASSIRVNSISPAFIGPGDMWDRQVLLQAETPSQYFTDDPADVAAQMIAAVPLRRYGSLDEVASAARFLLSDDASYITGFDIEVSGGAV